MYNFHLSLAARYLLFRRATKKLSDFFFLNWFYVCFLPLFSGIFLNIICYSINRPLKKNGDSVVFSFVLSSEVKKLTHLAVIP